MCCLIFKEKHNRRRLVGRMGNLSVKPSGAMAAKKPPKASQSKKSVVAASALVTDPSHSSVDLDTDSTMNR